VLNEAEAAVGSSAGFDPGVGVAYSSDGDGTLTVVGAKGNTYEVLYIARRWGGRRVCAQRWRGELLAKEHGMDPRTVR
jgi:hypothetical protein